MAKKQPIMKAHPALKIVGKYTWLVLITLIISCYLVYAFVSSIGIPLLSDPRPAVPFPMAFMLCLVLWVVVGIAGVKWLKLKWYKVVITIVVTILVFAVVLIGPSEYKEYQKRQLPKRAAEHAGAVVLHQGIQSVEEQNNIIYVRFLVPFEVTKKIDAHELPHMFEFVSASDNYIFSKNEQCNEEFVESLVAWNTKIYHYTSRDNPLLMRLEFLHFPDLPSMEDEKTLEYVLNNVFKHDMPVYDFNKQVDLQPGTTYFIYDSDGLDSKDCTAKDFINEKVTEPFIKVKK